MSRTNAAERCKDGSLVKGIFLRIVDQGALPGHPYLDSRGNAVYPLKRVVQASDKNCPKEKRGNLLTGYTSHSRRSNKGGNLYVLIRVMNKLVDTRDIHDSNAGLRGTK